MKTYRPPRKLLAEIDSLLNAKPSIQHSPLEEVIDFSVKGATTRGWESIWRRENRIHC